MANTPLNSGFDLRKSRMRMARIAADIFIEAGFDKGFCAWQFWGNTCGDDGICVCKERIEVFGGWGNYRFCRMATARFCEEVGAIEMCA